ncbi:hypothetical protein HDU98_010366 [Podochytrium sp. JEL0797]|nr:hypothetical protein HDU98_010366 [Podochytrium sp. JEL0797]
MSSNHSTSSFSHLIRKSISRRFKHIQLITFVLCLYITCRWLVVLSFLPPPSSDNHINDANTHTRPSLLSETRTPNGRTNLHLNASDPLCPAPKSALIGILTTTKPINTERRSLLREKYAQLNAGMQESDRIDFKFVFGSSVGQGDLLRNEVDENPRDTIVTERAEGWNKGKTMDWFHLARDLTFAPHPSIPGKWCKQYLFVGKTDDDSVAHVPRLSKMLRQQPNNISLYIGHSFIDDATDGEGKAVPVEGMHGMMYFISPDLIEWLFLNPVSEKFLTIPEDQLTALVLQNSFINVEKIRLSPKYLHDVEGPPVLYGKKMATVFQGPTTESTLVIHYCKNRTVFDQCMDDLFNRIPPTHPLLQQPATLQTRAKKIGLFPPSPSSLSSLLKSLSLLPNPTVLQIDIALIHDFISLHFSYLGFSHSSSNKTLISSVFSSLDESGVLLWRQPGVNETSISSLGSEISRLLSPHILQMRAEFLGGPLNPLCAQEILSKLGWEYADAVVSFPAAALENHTRVDNLIGECFIKEYFMLPGLLSSDIVIPSEELAWGIADFRRTVDSKGGFGEKVWKLGPVQDQVWQRILDDELRRFPHMYLDYLTRLNVEEKVRKLRYGERAKVLEIILDTNARNVAAQMGIDLSDNDFRFVVGQMHHARVGRFMMIENMIRFASVLDSRLKWSDKKY